MSASMGDVSDDANPAAGGRSPSAGPEPGDGDDPDDAAALAAYASALADGVERALPGWVERSVERLVLAYRGSVRPQERAAATQAGAAARDAVGPRVRQVLLTDIDAQTVSPLAVVRTAVSFPTEVLRAAGVPPVVRDEFVERQFPDDVYDLSPASFADLDPALRGRGADVGRGQGPRAPGPPPAGGAAVSPSASRVVAFVPDLMDRSKVAAATEGRVRFVTSPAELVEAAAAADLVVVDLGRPAVLGVLAAVVGTGVAVVAFGSHVDGETLAAARAAGCRDVVARSAFFADLAAILA